MRPYVNGVRRWLGLLLLMMGLVSPIQALAQTDNTVAVPDLTGLTAPKAAAVLNQAGLNLGVETNATWTSASSAGQNTINAQSIAAGQTAKPGTAIDVTILRPTNTILLYSDKTFTLVNKSGATLDLTTLTFATTDGTKAAQFSGTQWQLDQIDDGQCAQVLSYQSPGAVSSDSCSTIQTWLWTANAGNNFWTALNGVSQFAITQGTVQRGTCPTAQVGGTPNRCELYIPSSSEDAADYTYFAYTTDQLLVEDKSPDKWMVLDGASLINHAKAVNGSTFKFGDPKVFPNPVTVGQTNRLAPGQCLQFTNQSVQNSSIPEQCTVLARLDLDPSVVFWQADFEVNSMTDDSTHTCPAATPDKLTVCVVPR